MSARRLSVCEQLLSIVVLPLMRQLHQACSETGFPTASALKRNRSTSIVINNTNHLVRTVKINNDRTHNNNNNNNNLRLFD